MRIFTEVSKVGGNPETITLAQLLYTISSAVGPLQKEIRSEFYNILGEFGVLGTDKTIKKDTCDHFYINGKLSNGAPFAVIARNGRAFKDEPFVTLRIHGNKGDILAIWGSHYVNQVMMSYLSS